MNLLQTKGKWNIFKGRLKQTCARLIHNDQQFFEGKADELTGRIQMQTSRLWEKPMAPNPCNPRLTSRSNINTKA